MDCPLGVCQKAPKDSGHDKILWSDETKIEPLHFKMTHPKPVSPTLLLTIDTTQNPAELGQR